ncbi:hypothetical protein L1887_12805 [Cichorium endivia]|nr:hypothetical protein L1887_12805 [Cichorium endivia]
MTCNQQGFVCQPPMISYEKEDKLSENKIPILSTMSPHGLEASINMVEEALASIPLSFKRQETSKSILVIEKGILTLVQHQSNDQPQEMHKRGLRTSWTVHYVDGHFELPSECVKYILIRDKYRQRLSKFGKRLPNVETRMFPLSVHVRLEGWRVETRKRPDKTQDKFYHHKSSGRMFRSLVEVEKFIKYEIYPPKPRRPKKNALKARS